MVAPVNMLLNWGLCRYSPVSKINYLIIVQKQPVDFNGSLGFQVVESRCLRPFRRDDSVDEMKCRGPQPHEILLNYFNLTGFVADL